jgi:hypothetical protein
MSSFLQELQRRRVVRVLIAHGAGAFLVMQAFKTLQRTTGLGSGLELAVVHLVVWGVALALAFAGIAHVTPEGIRAIFDEGSGGDLGSGLETLPSWLDLRSLAISVLLVALGLALNLVGS